MLACYFEIKSYNFIALLKNFTEYSNWKKDWQQEGPGQVGAHDGYSKRPGRRAQVFYSTSDPSQLITCITLFLIETTFSLSTESWMKNWPSFFMLDNSVRYHNLYHLHSMTLYMFQCSNSTCYMHTSCFKQITFSLSTNESWPSFLILLKILSAITHIIFISR